MRTATCKYDNFCLQIPGLDFKTAYLFFATTTFGILHGPFSFFKVEAREPEMLLEFLPLLKSGQSCDSNLPIKTTRSSREYERIVVVEH